MTVKQKFDLYGQLILMLLSLTPFLLLLDNAANYKDAIFFYFYHALFLIVLGIWQVLSCIVNYKQTKNDKAKRFLKNNLLIALAYLIIFATLLEFDMLGKMLDISVIGFLLIADGLIIRYWFYLKKLYQS